MILNYLIIQGKEKALKVQDILDSLSDREYPIDVNIVSNNIKGSGIEITVSNDITNDEILTLSSDKINGEEHYCLSVHYNNIIHGSYIEPKRIRQPLDNCNTCFHILNIEK